MHPIPSKSGIPAGAICPRSTPSCAHLIALNHQTAKDPAVLTPCIMRNAFGSCGRQTQNRERMARILAVDDDPLVRHLSHPGQCATKWSSRAVPTRQIASTAFDVALVDYHLPFIDGLEVLQRLREVQPGAFASSSPVRWTFPDHGRVNRGEVMRR